MKRWYERNKDSIHFGIFGATLFFLFALLHEAIK